jgi:diguanylate cyclase (GGDEF)-like protein
MQRIAWKKADIWNARRSERDMPSLVTIAIVSAILAIVSSTALLVRLIAERRKFFFGLREQSRTITGLLHFSQTIQGAGKSDQIYPTLCHCLRSELELSGLAILTHDSEALPQTALAAAWPDRFQVNSATLNEVEPSMCPCLRQGLPWHFEPSGAPVRCVLDDALKLPATQAAYCIPFNFGRRVRVVVHMLLPEGRLWTEPRRQIAQAYVNAAQAALGALQLLAEAERQSMTDALTGLYNRRSLDQLLMREVALAERHSLPLSVVMIDLDNFKQINDAHGHAAGDHVLRALADCVRITLRKTDLAFRYGGDEFVIALPQTNISQAQQVMQKLRQAFATVDFSYAITRLEIQPTLSMGVAERSPKFNVLTMPQMLTAADQALYCAKNSTRDCIKVYEPPKAA